MTDWALPLISVHLVAPGSGRRPARVTALMDYLSSTAVWLRDLKMPCQRLRRPQRFESRAVTIARPVETRP
ncbi:hypothetical protein CQ035_05530 [Brevundimonas sp. MYb46]|nr:hypothetical protein CQ026_00885 [Brevundimonas sp. MYb31]PRA29123.1 hypothetical protein CQ024_09115 [Brevundimonas sp. MYb27]PRB14579.1 hypothetical protein CQ039_09425 [Brevundimonas sp. MYb52]PRB36648.1 hypothetical protein CQ035_05530 [Brevundimonas sp. MYb46]PRB55653.1 hypothetical protein CQ028_01940 [Brevundimonas sp. MYb33]